MGDGPALRPRARSALSVRGWDGLLVAHANHPETSRMALIEPEALKRLTSPASPPVVASWTTTRLGVICPGPTFRSLALGWTTSDG